MYALNLVQKKNKLPAGASGAKLVFTDPLLYQFYRYSLFQYREVRKEGEGKGNLEVFFGVGGE